jgi:hypothetical protein
MLLACSFVTITETEADTETREERSYAENANSIFASVSGPKTNDKERNRHGHADVGISDQPFHFLRQKTS